MTGGTALGLRPLEVAAGRPFGVHDGASELPGRGGEAPLAALERHVASALSRPPCIVSFSGGRDSSVVLAAAVNVARRHGLPAPIPVTLRFPEASESDETVWQERVVSYLRLAEWVRVELTDEVDLLGPFAAKTLRTHGLLWPPNTHFHAPILELARGGSVLTGIDGDGLFGSWRWGRAAAVLSGRIRPECRDARRLAHALAPRLVRETLDRRRRPPVVPWLRDPAIRMLAAEWRKEAATEPAAWNRRVRWYARRRALHLTLQSFDLIARDHDVTAVHPLAHPAFLSAVAAAGGVRGYLDRTAAMTSIFREVLPDDVLSRTTKAHFDGAFWNRHSREFVDHWDGQGVDDTLVDAAGLLEAWSEPTPHAATSLLLQAAWLALRRERPSITKEVGSE